jgi:hypothetical protein
VSAFEPIDTRDARIESSALSSPAAIRPTSSREVIPLRAVRSPVESASITPPRRRTGRVIDRASGMESPISSSSPSTATTVVSHWVRVVVASMSACSATTAASIRSFSASILSSTALLRSAIWSMSAIAADRSVAAVATNWAAKAPNASTSARIVANAAVRSSGMPAASTASAASLADCTSSATSPDMSWPSSCRYMSTLSSD